MNIDNFIIKEDVFILDEHELKDRSGKVVTKIDALRLEEIVRRNNKRIEDTGDEIPLVIGHTKDGASENDQPEIVGYASNLQVKDFFKTGKKGISATFKYFKDSVDRAKMFPRRSIELWMSDWKLDPISLLGATTPERDLGLVRFNKKGPKKYSRVLPMMNTSGGDIAEIVSTVVNALSQSDVWQWANQQMRAIQSQEMGIDDSLLPENDDDNQELMPEEMGDEEMPVEGEEEFSPEEGEEEPQEELEGEPEDSATPEGDEEEEVAEAPQKGGLVRMSKTVEGDIKIRLSRVEKENGELLAKLSDAQNAVEDIRLKYRRTQRERDIVSLEHDGYVLDREEEIDHVVNLDDATYSKHLDIIKKRYQRAPVNAVPFAVADAAIKAPGQPRSKEDISKIVKDALDSGITYEAALSKHSI